ncbi:substrate-binding periplasmic protein [Motilimonas sp. KMU-193]|uniref:substrate-binding periplasmic protein n=1 Tax=Motilimonas sp. KMU-193 TaxID=3388668 RepID=UPI00396B1F3B
MLRSTLLVSALLFSLSSWAKTPDYTVMTEDFFPFGYYNNQGELVGVAVEIVEQIMPSLDISRDIRVLPWARAVRDLDSHADHVLFAMARTPAREDKYQWVGPILTDRVVLFKRRSDETQYDTLDQAKAASSITVTRDYPEHQFLVSQGFDNLKVVTSPDMMVSFLMAQRTPLIVGGGAVVADMAKHAGFNPYHIQMTNIELFSVDLYIAMSKGTPEREVKRWQQALDEFKAKPDYRSLLVKYFFLPEEAPSE